MRSLNAVGPGAMLVKTPNVRQQSMRRRLTLACALFALALASGVAGALLRPTNAPEVRAATGPFSYFPS